MLMEKSITRRHAFLAFLNSQVPHRYIKLIVIHIHMLGLERTLKII